jgi:hypothetical protein
MAVHTSDQAAPARDWVAVTTSDTVNLPAGCRGIFVGGAGNLALRSAGGSVVTFTGVLPGTFLPVGPQRVMATNTTATLLVALY